MPDPAVDALWERHPESEQMVPADKPPIFKELGPHDYVESEFETGSGHCDKCGGGPDAKIHHYVDPMERIAEALEQLRNEAQQQTVAFERATMALEKIASCIQAGWLEGE
jgi:hypothetical protein